LGSGLGSDLAAGFAPSPLPMEPITAPTWTVSPSLTCNSPSTPEAGAFTSTATLSVSSSTSGSSCSTVSPGFLYHLATVASVIDSPSVGTTMSVMRPVLS
jgi:hypothetical protein